MIHRLELFRRKLFYNKLTNIDILPHMYQCILRDSCSEIIKKKQRMCLYHIYKQHCSPIPLDHCSFLTARTKNCAALRVLTRRLEPKATKINYKKPIFLRKKTSLGESLADFPIIAFDCHPFFSIVRFSICIFVFFYSFYNFTFHFHCPDRFSLFIPFQFLQSISIFPFYFVNLLSTLSITGAKPEIS